MRHALITAVLLAACATPQDLPPPQLPQRAGVDAAVAARADGVRFEAHGENFRLRLYDDRIALSVANGAELIFPRPEPQYPRWSGVVYSTENAEHRLGVSIRRDRPCPTDRGARPVEILLDGSAFTGCGRAF